MTPARETEYGPGAIRRLPERLAADGRRRVMLVCGKGSFDNSGAAEGLSGLGERLEVLRWSDFSPNPDTVELMQGLGLMAAFDPDVILGVGGGSPLDMAKLLCAYDGVADLDALHEAIRKGARVETRARGLWLVPTTSGSGSEATHFAVCYIGAEKFSVAGPGLWPDGVALDPLLTLSGSAHQKATSGIDAVCQATESLWARDGTDASRRIARHALGFLLPNIRAFVNEGTVEAARGMAIGAHLAGRAIDVSKTTAAHALSYAITKTYGTNHGQAVAMTLGRFIEAHCDPDAPLQPGIERADHQARMAQVLKVLDARDGREGRLQFAALLHDIGLVASLSEAGVNDPAAYAEIARTVNIQRLMNNPVVFTADQLVQMVAPA